MLDFALLAHTCAPDVHANTLAHVIRVESSYNPYAIGIVGAHLERQPRNLAEAIATATRLEHDGWNYSLGLGQINKANLRKFGLTIKTAFDPCRNLAASAGVLKECYARAYRARADEQSALRDAFSCYYSGNFSTGYKAGYVMKVLSARHTH